MMGSMSWGGRRRVWNSTASDWEQTAQGCSRRSGWGSSSRHPGTDVQKAPGCEFPFRWRGVEGPRYGVHRLEVGVTTHGRTW